MADERPWIVKLSPQVEDFITEIAAEQDVSREEVLDLVIGGLKEDLARRGETVTDVIVEPPGLDEGV